jgi:hypothetical protein
MWLFRLPAQGTNRFATILLYLSDVEDGGETFFPDAKEWFVSDAEAMRRCQEERSCGAASKGRVETVHLSTKEVRFSVLRRMQWTTQRSVLCLIYCRVAMPLPAIWKSGIFHICFLTKGLCLYVYLFAADVMACGAAGSEGWWRIAGWLFAYDITGRGAYLQYECGLRILLLS